MEERRRYKRISLSFPAEYRGEKVWQVAESRNISEGGIFLATEKTEPDNAVAEIIFDFGKEEKMHIYVRTRIVWAIEKPCLDSQGKTIPPGMGIEFTKFPAPEARRFIAKEIAQSQK